MTEKEACAFLGVSDESLRRAAKRLPWLNRRKHGGTVLYSNRGVAFLAEALELGVISWEIFSRAQKPPRTPGDAQKRPTAKREETA